MFSVQLSRPTQLQESPSAIIALTWERSWHQKSQCLLFIELKKFSVIRNTNKLKVGAANITVDGVEEVFEPNWELEVSKFDDMGLKEDVLRGIYGYGCKEPSSIQRKGILPIIQGKDTIVQVRLNKRLYS